MNDPYRPPRTESLATSASASATPSGLLSDVAAGQKLVIYSIIANAVAGGAKHSSLALSGLLAIAALVMAIMGLVKLGNGMQASLPGKILAFVCLFLPLINLLVLISINIRASRMLREAGYEVGLLGVK